MMIGSEYFKRSEFACKCGCGFATVDVELLSLLTEIRVYFNAPVIINSGCRCLEHNTNIGGSDGSKHMLGIAADIVVKGVSSIDVYTFIGFNVGNKYGLGSYNTFTHIDVRPDKARW